MKRLLFGLLVAGAAFGASAFKIVDSKATRASVYIISKTTDPGSGIEYYNFQTTPTANCNASTDPCQVTNKPSYPLPTTAPLRFPVADYKSANFNTNLTTFQAAL